MNRREVASRKVKLFQDVAKSLAHAGLTPNQISVASIVFAAFGAWGLYSLPLARTNFDVVVNFLIIIIGIQGRLICNLLDGLVAIEGGKKTAVGDLYNEVPDRISDSLLLLGAGLGIGPLGFEWAIVVGSLAALAALATAYARVLGGSLGLKQSFRGPMAKQHRMALLNIASVLSLAEFYWRSEMGYSIFAVLIIIGVGSLLTTYLRLRDIAKALTVKEQK